MEIKGTLKPVILRLIKEHVQAFIPQNNNNKYPLVMSNLYNPDDLQMDYVTLLEKCEEAFNALTVSF